MLNSILTKRPPLLKQVTATLASKTANEKSTKSAATQTTNSWRGWNVEWLLPVIIQRRGLSQGSSVSRKTRRMLEGTPEQVNGRIDVMVCWILLHRSDLQHATSLFTSRQHSPQKQSLTRPSFPPATHKQVWTNSRSDLQLTRQTDRLAQTSATSVVPPEEKAHPLIFKDALCKYWLICH